MSLTQAQLDDMEVPARVAGTDFVIQLYRVARRKLQTRIQEVWQWQLLDPVGNRIAGGPTYVVGNARNILRDLPDYDTLQADKQALIDNPQWQPISYGGGGVFDKVATAVLAAAFAYGAVTAISGQGAAAIGQTATESATGAQAAAEGTAGTVAVAGTTTSVTAAAGAGGATAAVNNAASGTTNAVLSNVDSFVKSAADAINTFIKPITDTIGGIAKTVQSINDNLIQPIIGPIQTIITQSNQLANSLESDLKGGLQGLIKIPGDIADALTSVDASFNRAIQQLGQWNADTVKNVLNPALYEAGTKPLTEMNSTLTGTMGGEKYAAAYQYTVTLKEEQTVDNIAKAINKFEDLVTEEDGLFGPLVKYLWNATFILPYLVKQVENAAIPFEHHVKMNGPYEALGPGQIIEAWRRGIMTNEDAGAELARNGINPERSQILYDLAQFLFGPTDTVNLQARGLIDDTTFNILMSQNNLDAGQVDALKGLLKRVFGPGEAAQLRLRNYIDQEVYLDLQRANLMNEEDALSLLLLSIKPVNSSLYLAMQGRIHAKEKGFMAESFGSVPDAAVKTAFEHDSKNDQEANLEQIAHWRMPPPEWWVTAYFRKIRTKTECYHAFEAANVPKEIWDDLFITEQAYPSVFQLPSMLGAGALSPELARTVLEKLGFPEELVQPFIDYGLQGSKTTKAATAGDLASLSLGNAKALFDDGVLSQQQYTEVLQEHGYSNEAAALTVEVAVIAQQRQARKDYAAFLVNEVKLGNVTVDDAVQKLYDNNFTAAEVAKYQLQFLGAVQSNSKQPSRADLAKMAKKGLIDKDLWLAMLQTLGYSAFWADLIIQIDG